MGILDVLSGLLSKSGECRDTEVLIQPGGWVNVVCHREAGHDGNHHDHDHLEWGDDTRQEFKDPADRW
jgi:hypothetical protein